MITAIHSALRAKRERLAKDEAGFTLIELLVVVLIIGVLAAIAIPVYLGITSNAKDSAVKADLTNIKTAITAYQTDNDGNLPTSVSSLTSVTIDPSNYSSTGTPAFKTAPAANATTYCVQATGSNSNPWHVTDSTAPASGLCP